MQLFSVYHILMSAKVFKYKTVVCPLRRKLGIGERGGGGVQIVAAGGLVTLWSLRTPVELRVNYGPLLGIRREKFETVSCAHEI